MKKLQMLVSAILAIALCVCMIPYGTIAQAETTTYTIWQADPYLAGKDAGDKISKNLTYNDSNFPVTVGKDDGGYYYTFTTTKGGWSYVDTGVGTSVTSWIKKKNVLNAIAPYVTYSMEYRFATEGNVASDFSISFRSGVSWNNSVGYICYVNPIANSGWKTATGTMIGQFTDQWDGTLSITPWGSSYPAGGYTMDFRNLKLQVNSENKDAINDALKKANITDVTYDTLVSYDEFIYDASMDDPNSYTIYDADPGLAGKGDGEIISRDLTYNKANFPIAVGKDKKGYYYTFSHTGGGWSYMYTGAKATWIKNTKVINAIAPYVTYSLDYRFTAEDTLTSAIDFSFRGYVDWNNSVGTIGWVGVSATTDEWKNYTGTMVGGFTESWSGGLAITPWSSSYPDGGYTFEFRNFKLQIKGKDKTVINKALLAAGITDVTFDTLVSYEPYEYVNVDTPIWYANPDRSLRDRGGDVDVTADINDDKTIPPLNYSTVVYNDEDEGETFYRTVMACQNSGNDGENTYFTSGISASDEGFGWMGDAGVIAALAPYMYVGFEYRFQSAGNIPSNAQMYMRAANWGSVYHVTTQTVTPGSWQVVEPRKMALDTFKNGGNWRDGEFMISIYAYQQSFSGTQIIDIRNLRVEIPSQYRTEINEALSKIVGIDEIANFTQGVELGTDSNGNKDYFALLSMAEKAVEFDLNDDNQLDPRDLVRLKKYDAFIINYMPEYIIKRADSNLDGILDSADLIELKKALIGK